MTEPEKRLGHDEHFLVAQASALNKVAFLARRDYVRSRVTLTIVLPVNPVVPIETADLHRFSSAVDAFARSEFMKLLNR